VTLNTSPERSKRRARGYSIEMVAEVTTFIRTRILSVIFDTSSLEPISQTMSSQRLRRRWGNPEWISSGDIVPIGKFARDLTRQYCLDKNNVSEEFFKLCLDMGLSLSTAQSIMQSVKQIR
jgi:hypothetical protein